MHQSHTSRVPGLHPRVGGTTGAAPGSGAGSLHSDVAQLEAALDSLGTNPAAMKLLGDRGRRHALLTVAAQLGRTQESVVALSRFLPASQEPDPSQGRWLLGNPADAPADLWEAADRARTAPPDDLVEHVSFLARFAPHTVDARLQRLSSSTLGSAVDSARLREGRKRLTQLRRQAGQRAAGNLTIPASMRWADSVVAALSANVSVDDAWGASVLASTDQMSVQRVVTAAAHAGDLPVLSRLLRCAPVVHDLDIIAERVLTRHGRSALEQLCRDVQQSVTCGVAPRRRLEHLLDGLAEQPQLDARFWSGQPVEALRREPLEALLQRTIAETLDVDGATVAAGLAPAWRGTLAELTECVENLLAGCDRERAPSKVAGTLSA